MFVVIIATVYDLIQERVKRVKLESILDCEVTIQQEKFETSINNDQKEILIKFEHEESKYKQKKSYKNVLIV